MIISLLEAYHAGERFMGRIKGLPISGRDLHEIEMNVRTLFQMNKRDLSPFAVKLADISPIDERFASKHGSQYVHYRDGQGDNHIGNEVWAVVRDGRIVTLLVRKDTQTFPPQVGKQHFRVDGIYYDMYEID
jgi:hypothetical protein